MYELTHLNKYCNRMYLGQTHLLLEHAKVATRKTASDTLSLFLYNLQLFYAMKLFIKFLTRLK